ncbi:MAG: hypothetical protein RPU52_08095 [Candidatus Sedimenticola sp. (ex Thyasira tokunagai)]
MVFGSLALFLVLATISSNELNDGKTGLVSYLVGNVYSALSIKQETSSVPVMGATNNFLLTEKDEKSLLRYVSMGLVLLSLVFSLLSEKMREFNLFYGAGVLASFCTLVFINPFLAVTTVCPVLIWLWFMRKRNNETNQ